MPTGYTASVRDGKITTLEQFAMQCARGFGACITMRDDPWDKPIPERFEPDTRYYDERIAEARAILDDAPKLSAAECERRATVEHADAVDQNQRWRREKQESRERYEAMIAKVEAWNVPPEVAELRTFMLDQLRQSIKFDCSTDYMSDEPSLLDAEAWRAATIEKAAKDLAYHTTERQKELTRVARRNEWLAKLRASLVSQPER